MFLCSLDLAVNVALPHITTDLNTNLRTIQWIIVLYVGGSTSLQLGLGSAADVFGLKRFYIIGLTAYALAVLLIGISPNLSVVLAMRLLQAVGNGLIMASVPALVTSIFPAEQRGSALGLMSGISTLGMIAATIGGGILIDSFGWRSIFLARLPLTIITLLLALTLLKEHTPELKRPFHKSGAALSFIGLAALILCLTLGGRIGWLSPIVLTLAAAAIASLTALIFVERKAAHPILIPHMLTHPLLAPVIATSFLLFMATFVSLFILPFYVSDVLKVDAKALGFLLMLSPAIGVITAPIGGWLSDRIPPAYLTTIALGIAAVAMFWFSTLTPASSITDVALRMAAAGIGMGLFQAANATLIMGAVSTDRLGAGGALIAMSRSLGTVTSVALMSALFAVRLDTHSTTTPDYTQAFVLAFSDTYIAAGAIAAIAVVISLTYCPPILRRRIARRHTQPPPPPTPTP